MQLDEEEEQRDADDDEFLDLGSTTTSSSLADADAVAPHGVAAHRSLQQLVTKPLFVTESDTGGTPAGKRAHVERARCA